MSAESDLPEPRTGRQGRARKRLTVALSAGFVALVAALVLVGWTWSLESLKRMIPGIVAMNPTTAIAFLFAAISLWGANGSRAPDSTKRRISSACALLVAAIGTAKLVAVLVGADLGVDQWLFASKLEQELVPNRMAPNTAFNFLLTGVALLLLHSRKRRVSAWAWALALLCGFLSLVVVLGYAYSIDSLYGVTSFIPMALHTAVCFLVLTYGVLSCQAGRGFLAILTGDNGAGSMARRVLPAVVLIPIVVGWLHLKGVRADLFCEETGVAIHSVAIVLVFAWLICWNALLLFRSDKGRARAERSVRRQHQILEDRVAERTAQLSIANAALEESRHDLEDRVQERTNALESALRINQQIMDYSLDVICIIDREGRFTTVSAACEQVWGYAPAELIGRRFIELVHPDDHEKTNRAAAEITTGKPLQDFENRYVRKDGSLVHVTWSVSWSHAEARMFCVARDTTERKRSEEALQQARHDAERANRAKSEFLANMSHEIRTPMNGILGMTELTLDTDLDREQREYLGMVKTSAHSLLRVINDILDFSKIEAGKLAMETISFSLRETVGTMLKPLGIRADQKQLELVANIPANVPDHLIGDPMRLRQILLNLTDNAIKFTERGEVVLKVTAEPANNAETKLHFSVSDTGIGIPEEKQAAIFEAFAQVDGSTTRHYGGTGLGLAIATRLVQQMRGRIWVESRLGAGTTFHFTAWLRSSEEPLTEVTPLNSAQLTGMRALIVDDNAVNCRILEETLSNWGMQPTAVRSAPAALAAMKSAAAAGQPFPLVLLDAMMPEVDGFALAEQIKHEPRLAGATVMMLTSAMRSGEGSRALDLGVHSVLTKPVMQSELLDAILRALSGNELAARHKQSTATSRAAANPGALRILLAEDNAINRAVASGILGRKGHTLVHASNGLEAIDGFSAQEFDVILMDIQMPEMDGFEATARIRKIESATGHHTPIVAMTAHAMAGDRERCLAAGMDDYLSKPIGAEDLQRVLDAIRTNGRAPTRPADNVSVHTHAELRDICDGDDELVAELIGLFRSDTPNVLDALRRAVKEGDAAGLAAGAHKLLSSTGAFGATDATVMVRQLEQQGRFAEFDGAEDQIAKIEHEIETIHARLARYASPAGA